MPNGIWSGDPYQGATGAQGIQGATGATGATGEKGDTGEPGVVQEIIAGENITVDNTNPASPVIASSGSSWILEQW